MTSFLSLLLLSGCPYPVDDTGLPEECVDIEAQYAAELDAIRTCSTWEECGQPLTGTSCGCTNNAVARTDADTTRFYALQQAGSDASCDMGGESTCDCPAAYGFDCVEGQCTWDYAHGAYLPDCQAERGEDFEVSGATIRGDDLVVAVAYGGGCETHTFTLCWPDQSFMESEPVQVNLELFHEGEDACDAWLSEDVTVSLLPLQQAWKDAYRQESGTITLHIGGQTLDYTF